MNLVEKFQLGMMIIEVVAISVTVIVSAVLVTYMFKGVK